MKSVLLAVLMAVVASGCSAIVIDEQQTAGTGGSGGQVTKALEVMASASNPASAKVCWGSSVNVLAADLSAQGAEALVDGITVTVIHGDPSRIATAIATIQSSGAPDQEVALDVIGETLVGVDGFVSPIDETATLTVVVTLGTPGGAGQDDYRFGIAGAPAISTADGRSVSGEFPLIGGTFTAYEAQPGETCTAQ